MVKAVVFDLDDTLYLERDFVRSGFHSVGEWAKSEYGIAGLEQTAWRLFTEGRRGDIFDAALAEVGAKLGKDAVQRMVQIYRTHPPRICLSGKTVECLSRLKGRCKLGLITDGPAEMQWNKIGALHLKSYLDQIIVTADLGEGFAKPHEKAFARMEESFGASGAAMVYVADNPVKDFVAPQRRGWRTIRIVQDGCLYRDAVATVEPEFCMLDLQQAAAVVEGSLLT